MDKENKQMDDVEEVDNTVCQDINGTQLDSNSDPTTLKANSSTDSYPYLGSASSNADSYSDSDTDVDFEPCPIPESSRKNSKLEKKFQRLFLESEVTSTPQYQTDSSQNNPLTVKNMDKDERNSHRLKKFAICDVYSNKCCHNNCIKVITHDIATAFRKKIQQFSEKERELMILAHLAFYRQDVKFSKYYKKNLIRKYYKKKRECKHKIFRNNNNDKTKRRTFFFFRRIQICRKLYLFLYDLELEKYEQIVAYFDKHELEPNVHKLVQKAQGELNKTI